MGKGPVRPLFFVFFTAKRGFEVCASAVLMGRMHSCSSPG